MSTSTITNIVIDKIVAREDNLKLVVIDVDHTSELQKIYRITSLPSVLYYENEELLFKYEGTFSKKDILDLIHTSRQHDLLK